MARFVEQLPAVTRLQPHEERRNALRNWITVELEDAISARHTQEALWREVMRLYEGVPKQPVKNFPIENAPNTEVTLGAIASDSIYAQALDLVYNISPILTVRAIDERYTDRAKAFQRWVNWGVANEYGLRPASEGAFLDDVQLGTGVYFIPWTEATKKTKVHRILSRGPRIFAVPPEDFFVPGGAFADLQTARWIAHRTWLTRGELLERARLRKWNVDEARPAAQVGWVRSRRENLGRTRTSSRASASDEWSPSALYEIFDFYAYYDIDGDRYDEDLLVSWDRTSRSILRVDYNPFDHRPYEAMRYQLRAHLFYGLGVLEMIQPYQNEATDIHNYRNLNMLLACTRLWAGPPGTFPEGFKIWPNKYLELPNPSDLKAVQMADIYPSSAQAEAITVALAERRVGVNDLSTPRPSQVLGSRTPGITALSLLQQATRRFTPAFDGMRLGTAAAVRQAQYRYQERLLSGDAQAEAHIYKVLGPGDGRLVVETLRDQGFDEALVLELTASSASINRDADRQNAILLFNTLAQYYQQMIQLVAVASNPQLPEPVRVTVKQVVAAATEIVDRTVRTFDLVRDPSTFILKLDEITNALGQGAQSGMEGLGALLGQLASAGSPGGDGNVPPTAGA